MNQTCCVEYMMRMNRILRKILRFPLSCVFPGGTRFASAPSERVSALARLTLARLVGEPLFFQVRNLTSLVSASESPLVQPPSVNRRKYEKKW